MNWVNEHGITLSVPSERERQVHAACLLEADGDEQAAQEAADYILSTQTTVRTPTPSIALAHDIHNRQAQSVLNRALGAARGLSAEAREDLATALEAPNSGAAILNFVDRYRLQLANLLSTTQLAALLEGAQEVAAKVPTLATHPGSVALPPTMEPHEAQSVVRLLERTRDATQRAAIIADLPPEQQEYARQAIIAREAHSNLPPPRWTPPVPPSGAPEGVHYPTIEAAVKNLAERNVMDRASFDILDSAARAKAFTVANVSAMETLTKIRDSLAENVREGADHATWRKKVLEEVGQGSFLSDAHNETVFRTNVQTAFSDGQASVLAHPLVRSGFPYASYDAIHDDRARENHLALEHHGIQKTNVYRLDDPVFQTFRPPWDYGDRCGWTPLTVRQAAERGIAEAAAWLATGKEPAVKAFVEMPPFAPPTGFQRAVSAAPLSVQLSLQPLAAFSTGWDFAASTPALSIDATGHEHRGKGAGGGQFVKGHGDESDHDIPALLDDPEQLDAEAEKKARGILTRLKERVIPEKVRTVADKVKGAVLRFLKKRYGEKGTGIILKVAALSAPIPLPGSQPAAIALSLVVAESVLAWKKLTGRGKAGAAMSHEELSAEEVQAAARDLLRRIRRALEKQLGAGEEDEDAALGLERGEKYFKNPPGEGWVQVRPGPLGGHIYKKLAVTNKPEKPKAQSQPPHHTAPSAIDPEHVAKGYSVIKRLAGKDNLAAMGKVRSALSETGIKDRAQQDAVINELRRAGRVSASALEGRHGASEEELTAALREGDSILGHLSVKLSVDAQGHEHRGKGPGGGQFVGKGKMAKVAEALGLSEEGIRQKLGEQAGVFEQMLTRLGEAAPKVEPQPEPEIKAPGGNETPPEASPWHGGREEVFKAMRDLGKRNDFNWEQARKLGPQGGQISVGSADFDYALKATVGDEYLRQIRQGKTPEEALEAAKQAGTDAIQKWNAQGVRGRVGINSKEEMKRWTGAGEAEAENVHRHFVQATTNEVPVGKPELPPEPEKPKEEETEATDAETEEKYADEPGVKLLRAPAGGATSEVDGKFYKGGRIMPVHGLYSGQEKSPKGMGQGEAAVLDPNKEGKGKERDRRMSPMSEEEIERRQAEAEWKKKATALRGTPLARMIGDIPDEPTSKEFGGWVFPPKWVEFAKEVGEEGVAKLAERLRPELDALITHPQEREHSDWSINDRETQFNSQSYGFSKKHQKEVPSSKRTWSLLVELTGKAKTLDDLHRLGEMMREVHDKATGTNRAEQEALDQKARTQGYFPNRFPGTSASGQRVKEGSGYARKNPATGKWETFSRDEVKTLLR